MLLNYYRYEKLLDKSAKRGDFLDEVMTDLTQFLSQATQLEQWASRLIEKASSPELSRLPPEDCKNKLAQLIDERLIEFSIIVFYYQLYYGNFNILSFSGIQDEIFSKNVCAMVNNLFPRKTLLTHRM